MEDILIGEKIKNFRKRAGMSQLELEVEIDAATGSVSRIESGKVNPTKETLLDIGRVLKLSDKELSDLMNIRPLRPTEEEIQEAIEEARPILESDALAYLLDDDGIVYSISSGFVKSLKLDSLLLKSSYGVPLMELVLNPKYGILPKVDLVKSMGTLILEISRITSSSSFARKYVSTFPSLQNFIAKSNISNKGVDQYDLLSSQNKFVFLKVNNESSKFYYSEESLKRNSRFKLVQYYTVDASH